MQTGRSFETSSQANQAANVGTRTVRILGLRRRFLVDRKSQLRAGLLTTGMTLVLLVLLNISLHASREQSTANILADAPELAPMLQSQSLLEFVLVLASSLVFLIGVFVVTVLETHKTAGAAYNLRRHMESVSQGQYNTRIHLRHDDTLLPLEATFNAMTTSIESRVWEEVETLEGFAERTDALTGPGDADQLGREIRARADELRRLAE